MILKYKELATVRIIVQLVVLIFINKKLLVYRLESTVYSYLAIAYDLASYNVKIFSDELNLLHEFTPK